MWWEKDACDVRGRVNKCYGKGLMSVLKKKGGMPKCVEKKGGMRNEGERSKKEQHQGFPRGPPP